MDQTTAVRGSRLPTRGAVLALLLAAFVAYVGNFHFVYGTGIALRKIPKVSWSLSETVINADAVKATPAALLPAKYPLFTRAAAQAAE